MRRRRFTKPGYVLVLTLGIIALASIALASLARHSLRLAAAANSTAHEVQHRWGVWSVRHVLLQRVPEILEAQVPDNQAGTPPWPKPSQVAVEFELGGERFVVTLADEDAKLNLATLYARKRERLLPALRQVSMATSTMLPSIRLVPQETSNAPFSSWGQVFDLAEIADPRRTVESIGRQLTCWGSGRVNVRRASDAVLRETALLALSRKDTSELIAQRRNWGGQGVDELLDELALRRPQHLAVKRLLDTESRNYSLLVSVNDGRREWCYQFVDNGRPVSFVW